MIPKDGARATVHVQHQKLSGPEEVAYWKGFWADWLAALDETSTGREAP